MAKDPAFLFYDGDAARDVSHLNRLERGCYFDIIQAQRKFGRMPLALIKKILGNDFDSCWETVKICLSYDADMYYIEWLENSTQKRKEYSESRRNNRLRQRKAENGNICQSYDTTYVAHMVNANENEIKDKEEGTGEEKGKYEQRADIVVANTLLIPEMMKVWKSVIGNYLEQKDDDYSACMRIAHKIADARKWKRAEVTNGKMDETLKSWKRISEFIKSDTFYGNLQLKTIDNQFQSIYLKMANIAREKENQKPRSPILK